MVRHGARADIHARIGGRAGVFCDNAILAGLPGWITGEHGIAHDVDGFPGRDREESDAEADPEQPPQPAHDGEAACHESGDDHADEDPRRRLAVPMGMAADRLFAGHLIAWRRALLALGLRLNTHDSCVSFPGRAALVLLVRSIAGACDPA